MTNTEQKEIFLKWSIYRPQEQRLMIDEYLRISEGNCSKDRFLNFLKDKLQVEAYWENKMVGMARREDDKGIN